MSRTSFTFKVSDLPAAKLDEPLDLAKVASKMNFSSQETPS